MNRRIIGRKREIQEHQRRIGPNTQRIARLLNNLAYQHLLIYQIRNSVQMETATTTRILFLSY
jgi:hypothetical protein